MYRKILFSLMIVAFSLLNAQTVFTQWNFEAQNFTPSTGAGTLSIENLTGNGVPSTGQWAAGNPGQALNTAGYPSQGSQNEQAGIKAAVSTAGLANISISWDNRNSNTGANRLRLQYTTDGFTWTNFEANSTNATNLQGATDVGFDNGLYVTNSGGNWFSRTADLSAVTGINNNPNFAVRFVIAFVPGTESYGGAGGGYSGGAGGGTIRYDNITFYHIDSNQVITPIATPAGGVYTSPQNVTLSTGTAGASIRYTTNGSDPTESSTLYSAPITISSTTTLKFRGFMAGMEPSHIATENYYFPATINSVSLLRSQPIGAENYYILNTEVVVTQTQPASLGNARFVQDATAGIYLYNLPTHLVGSEVGDGLTGICGTLLDYNGLLEFIPIAGYGTIAPATFPIVPFDITMSDMVNNFSTYQSRLVRLSNVYFVNAPENFANTNTAYIISNGSLEATFRTYFTQADYVVNQMPIPTGNINIIGLLHTSNGNFISSRNYADLSGQEQVATPTATPPGGTFTDPVNVTLYCTTPDAIIRYTTDGSNVTETSSQYSAPINITTTTTLKFRAFKVDMTPSVTVTEVYAYPANIANLAQLRAMPLGTGAVYTLNFEVIVTHTQPNYRNQRNVRDATAGLLIDDNANVITTLWNVGDGITGLTGSIAGYNGVIQFTPTLDPPPPTSTGNSVEPLSITVAQMMDNFDTYESNLVSLSDVSFVEPGVAIGNNQPRYFTDGVREGVLRNLYGAVGVPLDYELPAGTITIVGILHENTNYTPGTQFVTPRSINDIITDPNQVARPTATPAGGTLTAPVDVVLTCATPDAIIRYTTDGSDVSETSTAYTAPIHISVTTTLKFRAYKPGMSPSAMVTEVYTVPVHITNLAHLRTFTPDTDEIYTLNFEVICTFTQPTFRNQRYVQDATAGIVIDDFTGNITTLNIGDGITGLVGKLHDENGMLQFQVEGPQPAPSSTGNTITPVSITLSQMINNFETYEARLVRLHSVSFVNPTGNFEISPARVYNLTDGTLTGHFRTTFSDVDYIGTPIPTTPKDIIGILTERTPTEGNNGRFITARSLADFLPPTVSEGDDTEKPTVSKLLGNYPNPFNPTTTIQFVVGANNHLPIPVSIEIYNIKGQRVRALVNDIFDSGKHSIVWNGTDDSGKDVASGLYFYRMTTPQGSHTKRAILMK